MELGQLVVAAFFALSLACLWGAMASAATRIYTGQGLRPAIMPEMAKTDAVRLVPGTYEAGRTLGQFSTWTAANDVQTITVTGTPTGGSFYLNFNGDIIGPIAFNANAAAVQALLDAAPQIGTGNSVVGGGPFPGTAMTVTFQGLMASLWEPVFTLQANALTGGSSPTVAIAHTTPGRGVGGMFAKYDDTLSDGTNVMKALNIYKTVVNTYGQVIQGGGQWDETHYSASVFIAGAFRAADLVGLDANGIADMRGRYLYGDATLHANTGTIIAFGC